MEQMQTEALEARIKKEVSGLSPEQAREVRLLCRDLMLEVRSQCLSITQDAANRIRELK